MAWIWKKQVFPKQNLRTKLISAVMITLLISLAVNFLMIYRVNNTIKNMDQVYFTNIQLEKLKQTLLEMEDSVYQYLNIQSNTSLEEFADSRDTFQSMISELDTTVSNHPVRAMERNLRNLAESYLTLADGAISAKQARDVDAYKASYRELQSVYEYMLKYIEGLSGLRFQSNSENYETLYQYLRYLERFMVALLTLVAGSLMFLVYRIVGAITKPLESLSQKAKLVSDGNWDVSLEPPETEDEVGTVTIAFNQMIVSINEYLRKTRESLEKELQMKERELAMERLLKDAQLKYLQAQINPHFLFNSLNAGMQLAMLEDADRTYTFIENMAYFFRYRLRKNGQGSTLREEIELLDNYMYIMNVRYANEIILHKDVDESLCGIQYPGMVLQPLVENALRHGLDGVEWEKEIWFSAAREGEEAVVRVRDNGVGMSQALLDKINSGISLQSDNPENTGNGVGIANVRERIKLYFGRDDVLTVSSGGKNMGTEITIRTPIWLDAQLTANGENQERGGRDNV